MTIKSNLETSTDVNEVRNIARKLLEEREVAIKTLKMIDPDGNKDTNDLIILCRKARGKIEVLRRKADHWKDMSEQQSESNITQQKQILTLVKILFPELDEFDQINTSWNQLFKRVRSLKEAPQQQCKDCSFLTDIENKHGERCCRWHPLYVKPTWGGCVNFTRGIEDCSTCSNMADDCYDENHGATCPNYYQEEK